MAKYAVCVIRDAALGDDDHLAFSRAFGPVEFPPFGGQRIAKEIYDVGNLTADGEIRPYNPDGPQPVDFERFHTDSPFNSLPTKWSLLLAYETPPCRRGHTIRRPAGGLRGPAGRTQAKRSRTPGGP